MAVDIRPIMLLRWLTALCAGMFAVHSVIAIWSDLTGRAGYGPVTGAMNLGLDTAIPTWFASALLGCCSVMSAVTWRQAVTERSPNRWHWLGLAVVFLGLSIDEVAALHERFGELGISVDNDYLYYSWVIVGAAFLLVFVAAYLPFLYRLDQHSRRLFITSGIIFVSGALIAEMFNAATSADGMEQSLRYSLGTGIEELLEFLGVSLFLFALTERFATRDGVVRISITAPSALKVPITKREPLDPASHAGD